MWRGWRLVISGEEGGEEMQDGVLCGGGARVSAGKERRSWKFPEWLENTGDGMSCMMDREENQD